MKHLGTRILKTPRLTLRPFTMYDVNAMYENWASDPVVTQYLFWETHPDREVTRAVLDTWVKQYAQDGYYNWAIEAKGEGMIGNISVVACSDADEWAEIGYVIGRGQWGKGIMTEALARVLAFLFGEVGLHRACLMYDVENVGSGRVIIKNGLTYEGTMRKRHRRKDGSWADLAVYGILREEWKTMDAVTDKPCEEG